MRKTSFEERAVQTCRVDDKSRGFNMSNLSRSADPCGLKSSGQGSACRPLHAEDTRLDLRMNPDSGPSAAEWLEAGVVAWLPEGRLRCFSCQGASVEEIAWVLREYGDDFQDTLRRCLSRSPAPAVAPVTTTSPRQICSDVVRMT